MFTDNPDFYPTPRNIIDKMLTGIDFRMIQSVLEPSAGKGDIVERVIEKFKYSYSSYYCRDKKWDIDCIELDENLQHILRGKGYRVVHDDFLTYNSYKLYDLIVMNPPFSNGDKHILKALDMIEQNGGQLVCLLNAETLQNPYSNSRKSLLQRLEDNNAEIEYINNAFTTAERKTDVTVALITVKKEKSFDNSIILDNLKQQEQYRAETTYNRGNIVEADFIKGIVAQYNFEVKAGLQLIAEYEALKPYMIDTLKKNEYSGNILELKLYHKDEDDNCSLANSYIKQTRMKYWEALFTSEQFVGMFTTDLRQKYLDKVRELRDYDFSLYNIYTIRVQLNKELMTGLEATIIRLFDEFSRQYHWNKEFGKNIHYFNGWKTNECWRINPKKVIIPIYNAFSEWDGTPRLMYVKEKLQDIEKVFNYLDNGEHEPIDLVASLEQNQKIGNTKNVEFTYFYVDFYKKGTAHIKFKYPELVHKFNIFAAKNKNWLPPSYGKTRYNSMTREEREIIDSFEGQESYNNVMARPDYYIVETEKVLVLA